MGRRQNLQTLLEGLGAAKVYFQPPETVKLVYPCIIYKRDYAQTNHANNDPYRIEKRYLVTVIDRDPDSDLPNKVAWLRTANFIRHYTKDGLNHDAYTIYF